MNFGKSAISHALKAGASRGDKYRNFLVLAFARALFFCALLGAALFTAAGFGAVRGIVAGHISGLKAFDYFLSQELISFENIFVHRRSFPAENNCLFGFSIILSSFGCVCTKMARLYILG